MPYFKAASAENLISTMPIAVSVTGAFLAALHAHCALGHHCGPLLWTDISGLQRRNGKNCICLWLLVPEISCRVMDVHRNTTRKLCAEFVQHSSWLTDLHSHKQCQFEDAETRATVDALSNVALSNPS